VGGKDLKGRAPGPNKRTTGQDESSRNTMEYATERDCRSGFSFKTVLDRIVGHDSVEVPNSAAFLGKMCNV
jgi:hypothetical protein